MENWYMVIYEDGRRTYPIPKEEAESLFEVYKGKYLLKIEKINPKRKE